MRRESWGRLAGMRKDLYTRLGVMLKCCGDVNGRKDDRFQDDMLSAMVNHGNRMETGKNSDGRRWGAGTWKKGPVLEAQRRSTGLDRTRAYGTARGQAKLRHYAHNGHISTR
jgi:hypothetical protein